MVCVMLCVLLKPNTQFISIASLYTDICLAATFLPAFMCLGDGVGIRRQICPMRLVYGAGLNLKNSWNDSIIDECWSRDLFVSNIYRLYFQRARLTERGCSEWDNPI